MPLALKNKKVVLGVCGGISAYKSVELLRLLTKEGAEVYVSMTQNAKQFVGPLTFETLSGRSVYDEVFDQNSAASMEHIRAAEGADLMVVAPATANMIGKMAHGLADDALSTLAISFSGPVLVAPAMNDKMYSHPAVRANIEILISRGVKIAEPETGELACGTTGQGRLADPGSLMNEIKKLLLEKADLESVNILVTAGPTREPIDPVRYISNPSSGKMGYAIAEKARDRGADVTLVSGPTHLPQPVGMRVLSCQTASEMEALVLEYFPRADVLVMTAAVGDFAPESVLKEKIKKRDKEALHLKLHPTKDILLEAGRLKTRQMVVGFAAESGNLIESAREKLREKRLDMIVANDISAPGIGFQSDSNQVTILTPDGEPECLPLLKKTEIADLLLDRIRNARSGKA